MANSRTDFTLEGGGSIYLLRPVMDEARAWVEEHIDEGNGFQPYCPQLSSSIHTSGTSSTGFARLL